MAARLTRVIHVRSVCVSLGEIGKGAGKSGGSGGSIRSAGGAFGRLEAAREEEYFHHLQANQIKLLKQQLEELSHPETARKKTSEREILHAAAEKQRVLIANAPQVE